MPLDEETKSYLERILTETSGARRASERAESHCKVAEETAVRAIGEVAQLRRDLYGSKPPPASPPGASSGLPLVRAMTQSQIDLEQEIEETKGDADRFQGAVLREFSAVRRELTKQSTAMGLVEAGKGLQRFAGWARTPEGRNFFIAAAAVLALVVQTFKPAAPAAAAVVRVETTPAAYAAVDAGPEGSNGVR